MYSGPTATARSRWRRTASSRGFWRQGGGRLWWRRLGLDRLPGRLELFKRRAMYGLFARSQPVFDGAEARRELVVGFAERRFRIVSELASQVGYGEQKIAKFFRRARPSFRERGTKLARFLFDLFDD